MAQEPHKDADGLRDNSISLKNLKIGGPHHSLPDLKRIFVTQSTIEP